MRFAIQAALCFSLLTLFALGAYAIESGSTGLSADQLIDVSNGRSAGSWGEQGNPKEARERWNQESSSASQTANNTDLGASAVAASNVASSKTSSAASTEGATGNWTFSLQDVQNRIMVLTLYESDGNLVGDGTISEFNGTEAVSASGSLNGDELNLNLTSSGTIGLCTMSLKKTASTASGEYTLFPSTGEPLKGTAQGMLSSEARAET